MYRVRFLSYEIKVWDVICRLYAVMGAFNTLVLTKRLTCHGEECQWCRFADSLLGAKNQWIGVAIVHS